MYTINSGLSFRLDDLIKIKHSNHNIISNTSLAIKDENYVMINVEVLALEEKKYIKCG